MELFLLFLLAFWIVPVVVLFNKGQTGWAWSGFFLGWKCAFVWIIAAIAAPNRKRAAMEEERRMETLIAMSSQPPPGPVAQRDTSIEGRLETLSQLMANGQISAEEYESRRQAILDDI